MGKCNFRINLVTRFAVYLVMIAVLVFGQAQPVAAEPASIYGYVHDLDGTPIENCYIAVSDENNASLGNVYTNSRGYYEVNAGASPLYHIWTGKTENNLFTHIPQIKTGTYGQVDFSLSPGANIILEAYDQSGNLLRNQDFLNATGGKVFATDLNDMPQEAYLGAIHDSQSNWDWNLAIPTLIVKPGLAYKLSMQWEVPGFGKVVLSADNDGQGYSVAKPGGSIELNVNYELAKSSLNWLKNNADKTVNKNVSASKRYFESAEKYLADSQIDEAMAELDLSLKETLWASEKLVLSRAQKDIEKYREGELTIKLVDQRGNAVSNAKVTFQQTSHDFLFGANPLGRNGAYDESLAQLMKQAGINQTYITVRWGLIESAPGLFDWTNIDNYQQIDRLLEQGFRLVGALSLWLCNMTDFTPDYLYDMSFEALKDAVHDYTYTLVSRYEGKIDVWEMNELNLSAANALGLTLEQRQEIAQVFARSVKEANPQALILHSSCALPYEFSDSPAFLQLLKQGTPADIIGLEFYYSGVNQYGYATPQLDMLALSKLIDHYAALGKPIYIKELAAPSTQLDGSAWWHDYWDEETQAEYVTSFYTMAFSKPQVKAITWGWGVLDADAWTLSGGLLSNASTPKPSYWALKKLIESWTTNGQGKTNKRGEYTLHGFAGDYDVSIRTSDGHTYQQTVHIGEQASDVLTIVPSFE